jgi:hypothetical protein
MQDFHPKRNINDINVLLMVSSIQYPAGNRLWFTRGRHQKRRAC